MTLSDLFHRIVDALPHNSEADALSLHAAVDEVLGQEGAAPSETPSATPAAQAHADELGVDLSTVEGSGAGGTITKADVAQAADAQTAPETPEQPQA